MRRFRSRTRAGGTSRRSLYARWPCAPFARCPACWRSTAEAWPGRTHRSRPRHDHTVTFPGRPDVIGPFRRPLGTRGDAETSGTERFGRPHGHHAVTVDRQNLTCRRPVPPEHVEQRATPGRDDDGVRVGASLDAVPVAYPRIEELGERPPPSLFPVVECSRHGSSVSDCPWRSPTTRVRPSPSWRRHVWNSCRVASDSAPTTLMPRSHQRVANSGAAPVSTAHVATYPLQSMSAQVIPGQWRTLVICVSSSRPGSRAADRIARTGSLLRSRQGNSRRGVLSLGGYDARPDAHR